LSTECFLDETASCDRVDADCEDNRNDAAVVLSSAYPVPDPLDQDSERTVGYFPALQRFQFQIDHVFPKFDFR
jgi:hypothetical protein